MDCSVVIVTYNSAKDIGTCLDSVLDQSFEGSYEVVVADNGSTDGTPDIVRDQYLGRYENVRLLELGHNYGAAGGGNRAFLETEGDYVANLDPDTTVHRDWLHHLHTAIEGTGVAVAHSCIFEPYHPQYAGLEREKYPDHRVVFEFTPFGFVEDHTVTPTPLETLHAPGGAMMIDRSVAEELDYLFDEDIPFPCEDLDLGLRLNALGETVLFVPDAILYHRQDQKQHIEEIRPLVDKYQSYMEGRSTAFYKTMTSDEYLRFLPRLLVGNVLNLRVMRISRLLKLIGYPAAMVLGTIALMKSLLANPQYADKRRAILSQRRKSIYRTIVNTTVEDRIAEGSIKRSTVRDK